MQSYVNPLAGIFSTDLKLAASKTAVLPLHYIPICNRMKYAFYFASCFLLYFISVLSIAFNILTVNSILIIFNIFTFIICIGRNISSCHEGFILLSLLRLFYLRVLFSVLVLVTVHQQQHRSVYPFQFQLPLFSLLHSANHPASRPCRLPYLY